MQKTLNNMNQQTETLHIFIRNGHWHVKSSDARLYSLFGTDTLPLPFNASYDSHEVLKHVYSKNPLANLTIES